MINLSQPDNTNLHRGRPLLVEALWHWIGSPFVRSGALPFPALKCAILRLFGARIGTGVYLKPGIRVKFPWYLRIGDYCWIGENVWIDNLAEVTIGDHVCVSQGAYLCTGNHDWSTPNMKLFRQPVVLNDGSWVGAMAIVCPGVTLGQGSIATAGAVVTRGIGAWEIHSGNPAMFVKSRQMGNRKQVWSNAAAD